MKLETTGHAAVIGILDRAPAGIAKALVAGMVTVGLGLLAHLKQDELSGQSLAVRTGTGRRAAFYRVETGNDNEVAVVVGEDLSKAKYMRAQDQGADISPKSAQSLTIPIGPASTGKGVARFSARDLINSPGSFGYVGTFVRDGILFGAKGKKERPVPLFILAKHVRLRKVGYLAHTLSEKLDWAREQINQVVAGELHS